MSHLELLALVSTSYLLSLWGLERWRRFRRRVSSVTRRELTRPHVRRALAPLGAQAETVIAALERFDLPAGRAAAKALEGLTPQQEGLLSAAVGLCDAFSQGSDLARYRAASEALVGARRARQLGPTAAYLESLALLGFLSDSLTEDLRLWQTGRRLSQATLLSPDEPLLQLAAALRSAIAGQPSDCVAALARALYHARADAFVIDCISSVPLVEELSPGLADEARRSKGLPP